MSVELERNNVGVEGVLPAVDHVKEFYLVLETFHRILALSYILTVIHPLPYGRYVKKSWFTRWTVSSKHAIQGLSFTWFVPVIFMVIFNDCTVMTRVPNMVAISMFAVHYAYRGSIYPTLCTENATPWPGMAAVGAIVGCIFNGYVQAFHLLRVYEVHWNGLTSFAGIFLFVTGLGLNIYHDKLLADLRRKGKSKTESSGDPQQRYFIPQGGLFNYVSAANYFGEIVEWWGWAIFTRGVPQISMAILTTLGIGIRGWKHHQFYRATFGKAYPPTRKAIIPFLL